MSRKQLSMIGLLLCVLLLPGCGGQEETFEKERPEASITVEDKASLYDAEPGEPVLYLTVHQGNESDGTDHTWSDLNARDLSWYQEQDLDPPCCDATVQFGSEEGAVPGAFGYGAQSANARIRLNGLKSSARQQKSYRVDIKSGMGNLEGMKTFYLKKSFTDPFRFMNKLVFDLLAQTEGAFSCRTRLVHLYVRDRTEGEETLFADYGLYTLVEPINKRYLRNRSLDATGELYQAEQFDFARHADVLLQPTDPAYDKASFEALLDSKGSNDYSKLLALLDRLNDDQTPIEDVVEQYFDRDNLYTWLAANILLDNPDTDTENFYLYSPTGTEQFYILPWDNDAALRRGYETLRDPTYSPGWERGIFLYTESKLFSRMMKSERCTNRLSEYITALHDGPLSPRQVQERAIALSETVLPLLYSLPDQSFARVTRENYDKLLEGLGEQIDENFYGYYDPLETPWPFHILTPEQQEGEITLRWEESFALNHSVDYSVELDDDWLFADPILKEEHVSATSINAGALEPGQYFLRVTARTEAGVEQEAFERYNTERKSVVHGVLCFYVFADGTVVSA